MPDLTSYKPFGISSTSYSKAKVRYFPGDEWMYGGGYVSGYDSGFVTDGIFEVGGSTAIYGEIVGIDSYGKYMQMHSGATLDNECWEGVTDANAMRFYGDLDFRVLLIFRLVQTSGFRFYYGINSVNPLLAGSDDILGYNSAHGFGLLVQEGGNFKITSNNGSTTSYITSDIDTIDTDVHRLYLESDSSNSRWGYSWDGSSITYISTQNPSGTTLIQPYFTIKNRENGVNKSFKIYILRGMQKYKL